MPCERKPFRDTLGALICPEGHLERPHRRCNGNRRGHLSQAVDRPGNRSEIGRSFRCRIDDLSVSDVEFLRKVEGMQDDMARFVK